MEIMGGPKPCHHSGSGNGTAAHVRRGVSGPGRAGVQAVACTSEGACSALDTAAALGEGTPWSTCGRARGLGHHTRFLEETSDLQKSKEDGHRPAPHWKPIAGWYSPPIMRSDHRIALIQKPDSELGERPWALESDRPGF